MPGSATALIVICNVVTPQTLWFGFVRRSPLHALDAWRSIVQVGMWTERFVIIVPSLQQGFPAGQLGHVRSDVLGLRRRSPGRSARSFLMFLIFAKLLPSVCMFEMRELVHTTDGGRHAADVPTRMTLAH